MTITTPTPDEAEHISRTVDESQAFVGTILSPSAGARAAHLFSLEMVDRFLEARTIEDFRDFGLRPDIHYVDFGFLAQWFDEVVGDVELAAEIQAVSATDQAFGLLVPRVKKILGTRLAQCHEVMRVPQMQVVGEQ